MNHPSISKLSTFQLEQKLLSEGYDFVIGIDEAGRGPLAGPVVAVATTVRNFQFSIFNFQTNSNDQISNDKNLIKKLDLIRDSKKLSEKQRESMYDFIHEHFHVGVGICDHKTIDRINILEATYLAMKKALAELAQSVERGAWNVEREENEFSVAPRSTFHASRKMILVDGNKVIPNLSVEQKAIISGDKIVKSISAASIIAKVTRDRIMREMHEIYPQYCFDQHKGYGTKTHTEMIKKHGPCQIHRYSFEPIKSWTKCIKTDKMKLGNKP